MKTNKEHWVMRGYSDQYNKENDKLLFEVVFFEHHTLKNFSAQISRFYKKCYEGYYIEVEKHEAGSFVDFVRKFYDIDEIIEYIEENNI